MRIGVAVISFVTGASLALAPLVVLGDANPRASSADGGDAGDATTFKVIPFISPLPTPPDLKFERIPADPPAMREKRQWIFDLRYDKGDAYLVSIGHVDLDAPQETPRAMGRFALELYEGAALIERVRFDFPLLGATEVTDAGYKTPPSIAKRLVSRIGVYFPATSHGTRLELWDRATNKRWTLPWPVDDLDPSLAPSPADAAPRD